MTEGSPYGRLPFERSGTPVGLPCGGLSPERSGILRRGNPPVRGLRRGQPPFTRGPVGGARRGWGLRLAAGFPPLRRGGIYPARGCLRRRGVPGRTMCAPTWVAVTRGVRLAAGFPPVRMGGFYIRPRAFAAARGSRADMESAPTWGAVARGLRLAAGFPPVRRGGIYPARGVCGAAGCGGMRASRPTVAPRLVALRFDRVFAGVCSGGS